MDNDQPDVQIEELLEDLNHKDVAKENLYKGEQFILIYFHEGNWKLTYDGKMVEMLGALELVSGILQEDYRGKPDGQ